MNLRSMRYGAVTRPVDGYFARAVLAIAAEEDRVVARIVAPLHKEMARTGLGRIAQFEILRDAAAELGERLVLVFSLANDAPAAMRRVAAILEEIGAPPGSTIGNAECPEMLTFGRAGAPRPPRGMAAGGDREDGTLDAALRGRECLLEAAVRRVIAAEVSARQSRGQLAN